MIEDIPQFDFAEFLKKQWAEDYSRLTRQAVVECPFVSGAEEFLEQFKS